MGDSQLGREGVGLGGFATEEAVGEGPADVLMEENEHEGNTSAFSVSQ